MLRSTLILSFSTCSLFLVGQDLSSNLSLGETFSEKKSHFTNFLDSDESSIYAFGDEGSPGKEFYLQKYDISTLELVKEWKYPGFEYQNAEALHLTDITTNTGFHILFEAFDKKADIKYLLHRMMDKNGNLSPVTELMSMETNRNQYRKFIIRLSADSTKTMVYADKDRYKEEQIPEIAVFDENFDLMWKRKVNSPYKEEGDVFAPVRSEVSNEGEVFIIGFKKDNFKYDKKTQVTDTYSVVRINGQEQVDFFDLSSLDKTIHMISLKPDINGRLLIVGFYSDSDIKGSLCISLEQSNLNPVIRRVEPFSNKFLSDIEGRGTLVQKLVYDIFLPKIGLDEAIDLKSFEFKDFINWPDGSVSAIAEKYYSYSTRKQGMVSQTVYSKELIVSTFDANGVIKWIRVIPKNQELLGEQKHYTSYGIHYDDRNIYLMYNDDERNIDLMKEGKGLKRFGGTFTLNLTVTMATVHRSGEVEYGHLVYFEDNKTLLAPRFTKRISNKKALVVLANMSGHKIQLGNLSFP